MIWKKYLPRLQFGIRSLLLFTAAVAIFILPVGKILSEFRQDLQIRSHLQVEILYPVRPQPGAVPYSR